MSAIVRPDRSLIALPRRLLALRRPADEVQDRDLAGRVEATTTVRRALISVATCLLLALLLDAHGIVHSGEGMPDGAMRDVTLAVGNVSLRLAEATHLDWPWTRLHAALGYGDQPSVAPLLASGVSDGPRPGAGGGAVLGGMPSAPIADTTTATPTATATPRPLPTRTALVVATHPAPGHSAGSAMLPPVEKAAVPGDAEARVVRAMAQKQAVAPAPRLVADHAHVGVQRAGSALKAAQPSPAAHPRGPTARQVHVRVYVTAANTMAAIGHAPSVFSLGVSRLYCWVRNSGLPPHLGTLTFRWIDDAGGRVVDQFPVTRSSWAYTGAYDQVVTATLGVYRCEVRAGGTVLGSVRFTISLPPLRVPTSTKPLRLLVTGDSLTGYLGPVLVEDAASLGPVKGTVDTHNGTGLTRPDFVDWSVVARQQMAQDNPDAVVVMMGGNDFQNMTLPNGQFFQAGTPAWTREYERRAAIVMRIWTQGGTRRVYWLSMPPARDPTWAYDDNQINIALRAAAKEVPGAEYLNILGPVTNHGKYTDYVYDGHGQPILIREPDGVHLNLQGSTIVAQEVLPVLEHDWHLH